MGLVWDLRSAPIEVVNNEHRLGRTIVEKVARQLADTFSAEKVATQVTATWEDSHMWPDIQAWARETTAHAAARLSTVHLPELPTAEEMRHRAAEMFRVPEVSLDEVSERARVLLIQAVSVRILSDLDPLPA